MFDFDELEDDLAEGPAARAAAARSAAEEPQGLLLVEVALDADLGLATRLEVPRRCRLGRLKELLAAEDPTGQTSPASFELALPPSAGAPPEPLPDGTELTEAHGLLCVCPQTPGSPATAAATPASAAPPGAVAAGAEPRPARATSGRSAAAREAGGRWQDLDGQAVGPWPSHAAKVTTVLFDCFGGPPHGGRRLYTACWEEGRVCCWELARGGGGGGGKTRASPRLLGELEVGGFVGDIALLSEHGLAAALVGAIPEGGFVCHSRDFVQAQLNRDDTLGPGETVRTWDLRGALRAAAASAAESDAALSTKVCMYI